MDFNALVEAILANRVMPSRHSLSEAANDDLKLGEIYASVVEGGEIIEDYPSAYPTPTCLVLGFNMIDEPIHSVWSYDRIRQIARLVTVYRPDAKRWANWRIRR